MLFQQCSIFPNCFSVITSSPNVLALWQLPQLFHHCDIFPQFSKTMWQILQLVQQFYKFPSCFNCVKTSPNCFNTVTPSPTGFGNVTTSPTVSAMWHLPPTVVSTVKSFLTVSAMWHLPPTVFSNCEIFLDCFRNVIYSPTVFNNVTSSPNCCQHSEIFPDCFHQCDIFPDCFSNVTTSPTVSAMWQLPRLFRWRGREGLCEHCDAIQNWR